MTLQFASRVLRTVAGSSLLAVWFGFSAHAALTYSFNYSNSGPVPQDGTVFSVEQTVSGIGSPISSIELTLNFSQGNTSLTGNSSGIQGSLNLGTGGGSPSVTFYPVATSISGPNATYDVTFSGSPGTPGTGFNGLNPNDTWGLVLWDNSGSGLQNALSGWSLNVTVVPEPVNVALGVFGVLLATSIVIRHFKTNRTTDDA